MTSDRTPRTRAAFGDVFEPLLAAACSAEPWAWERLYGWLSPVVLGYLRSQSLRDAEDRASEVSVGVFRNIATFSGTEDQFRSWVFVVAHRRVQDERRRLGRRPEPAPLDSDDQGDPVSTWADPADDEAVSRVAADRLRETCERLAPDQRDVVLLRALADLTVEQTATVLGKSEGAVKALQRRGFGRLRQLLVEGGVPL